ncbi:carbonic anhydrase 12 isoform X1 [Erpetoichthys calabaricus]|nr:carbonic anhydrase 12 isoform X1 [Erpetoichthys calabaricus]
MTWRCLLALLTYLIIAVHSDPNAEGRKWTYTGPDGELYWDKNFPYCGGVHQSPIDIRSDVVQYDASLQPVELLYYDVSGASMLSLKNNGHSVELSLPSSMCIGGLPYRYSAAQLHLHWGSTMQPWGSEHTINGKRFAAELHIVHFNSDKYADLTTAADKADGLAVLGVFIKVGQFSPAFNRILKHLSSVKFRDQVIQVLPFDIRDLLPEKLNEYYRYDGSLTTPPCYPSVLWTIFRQPVEISSEQLNMLVSKLYCNNFQETVPVMMVDNFRHTKDVNRRRVSASFREGQARTSRVPPPNLRRHLIQKLKSEDLGDLTDDEMAGIPYSKFGYPELPASKRTGGVIPGANDVDWEKRSTGHAPGALPEYWSYSGIIGETGNPNSKDSPFSFSALEKYVRLLKKSYSSREFISAIREAVCPELNVRSYLEGRSSLMPATVQRILQVRRAKETAELNRGPRRIARGQRGGFNALRAGIARSSRFQAVHPKVRRTSNSHPKVWNGGNSVYLHRMNIED